MIIEVLREIQFRGRLQDAQIAEKLGIHPVTWNRLKNGRSGLDIETIRKAVRAYPAELAEPVMVELYGENYRETALPAFKRILEEIK